MPITNIFPNPYSQKPYLKKIQNQNCLHTVVYEAKSIYRFMNLKIFKESKKKYGIHTIVSMFMLFLIFIFLVICHVKVLLSVFIGGRLIV